MASPLDASRCGEWLDGGPILSGEGGGVHATVRDLLAATAALASTTSRTYIDFDAGDAPTLSGVLLDDEGVMRFQQDLGTAIRLAGALGAKCDAWFIIPPAQVSVQFVFGKKKSKLEVGPVGAAFQDEGHARTFLQVNEWVTATNTDATLTREAYRAGEARYWLPEEPLEVEQPVVRAVLALEEEALEAARKHHSAIAPDGVRCDSRFVSSSALRAGLESNHPAARIFAISLLAAVKPAEAEVLARGVLVAEPQPLRAAAVGVLAGTESRESIDAVVDAVRVGKMAVVVEEALAKAGPHADDALLAHLDSKLFEPSSYVLEESLAQHQRTEKARVVASSLATRNVTRAYDKLERLFLDEHPGAIVIRGAILQPLVRLDLKRAEAHSQKIQAFSLGMGLALNQDLKRRSELLGQSAKKGKEDYAKYRDLSVGGLEKLLAERFIDPNARQNDAPCVLDFLAFMHAWPECTAHGYTIGPQRDDYRVMIEGLDCDLTKVAADRKEALRAAFTALCESANQFEAEGDQLTAWWT